MTKDDVEQAAAKAFGVAVTVWERPSRFEFSLPTFHEASLDDVCFLAHLLGSEAGYGGVYIAATESDSAPPGETGYPELTITVRRTP